MAATGSSGLHAYLPPFSLPDPPPPHPPSSMLLPCQAQERGELVKLQDDASYAMDGLSATCRLDTQQDSAVTLTEMLSTRKGRVALR